MFFFQAEDGMRGALESRGLGDVCERQGCVLSVCVCVVVVCVLSVCVWGCVLNVVD